MLLIILLHSAYHFTGVQKIIVPCTSLRTSKEALRLARIYPGALYSTAGILPTCAQWCIQIHL